MNARAFCLLFCLTAAPGVEAGRFVVRPPEVRSQEWRALAREMHESDALQALAEGLNEMLVLPRDVSLRIAECGEPNAYYDPEARAIAMCVELMHGMAETLEGQFEDEDESANALAGAWLAVLLHEVGHALVDVLELPVTGREEDAVDQLSAWLLIEEAEDVDSVLGAAATYYTDGEAGDDEFADEHSLDRQRYFNLLCWAYGSDPASSAYLIERWDLPESRAGRCVEEYARLDRSWTRLLAPHRRRTDARESPRAPAPAAPRAGPEASPAPTKVGRFQPVEDDD